MAQPEELPRALYSPASDAEQSTMAPVPTTQAIRRARPESARKSSGGAGNQGEAREGDAEEQTSQQRRDSTLPGLPGNTPSTHGQDGPAHGNRGSGSGLSLQMPVRPSTPMPVDINKPLDMNGSTHDRDSHGSRPRWNSLSQPALAEAQHAAQQPRAPPAGLSTPQMIRWQAWLPSLIALALPAE